MPSVNSLFYGDILTEWDLTWQEFKIGRRKKLPTMAVHLLFESEFRIGSYSACGLFLCLEGFSLSTEAVELTKAQSAP